MQDARFNFLSRDHLCMALLRLPMKFGADIFIQCGVIDTFSKIKDGDRRHLRFVWVIIIIIIIISLLRTHVRRTCLHSKDITMKHTTVILCYTIENYIG